MKGTNLLKCPCGCGLEVEDEVVKIAKHIERQLIKKGHGELTITSGARCAGHNQKIGGARNSAHILGKAVDVATPNSAVRFIVDKTLYELGVERIGRNVARKFTHFDTCTKNTKMPDGKLFYPTKIAFDY